MSDQNNPLLELLTEISHKLISKKQYIATAESCTGGGIAKVMTDLAGSSQWFDCGFVTYSNESKVAMLGLSLETIIEKGAVSEETVKAMALAALHKSKSSISVAVSGIAGPDGGSENKPVGTVCFAWAGEDGYLETKTECFQGDRENIRKQSVMRALEGIKFKLNLN